MRDYNEILDIGLLFNYEDLMIYTMNKRGVLAYLLIEDTRRPGNFEDFKFIYPERRHSKLEKEWDDFRNLMKVSIFVEEENLLKNNEYIDELIGRGQYIVESKDSPNVRVNHVVKIYYDKSIDDMFIKGYETGDFNDFIKCFEPYIENKSLIKGKTFSDWGHLKQSVK